MVLNVAMGVCRCLFDAPKVFTRTLMGHEDTQIDAENSGNRYDRNIQLTAGWEKGIDHDVAGDRLTQYGLNHHRPNSSKAKMFVNQFASVSSLSLLGLTGLSLALGKYFDVVTIGVTFLAQAGFTTRLKLKSEQSYQRHYETEKTATVVREGRIFQIAPAYIVPGDVILIRPGDVVPADAIILRSSFLQVREIFDNGNQTLTKKTAIACGGLDGRLDPQINLSTVSDENMLFARAIVISGSAQAVVTATGCSTRVGQQLSQSKHQKLFTEHRYNEFSKQLTKVGWITAIATGGLVLVVGWPVMPAIQTASTIATAIIPGGFSLPICLAFWTATNRTPRKRQDLPSMDHVDRLEDAKVIVISEHGLIQDMQASALCGPQSQWLVTNGVHEHQHSGKLLFYKHGIQTEASRSPECVTLVQAAKLFARAQGEMRPFDQAVNRLYGNLNINQQADVYGWGWVDHAHLQDHGLFEMRAFQNPNGQVVEVIRGPAKLLFDSCNHVVSPEQDLTTLHPSSVRPTSDSIRKSLSDWLDTTGRHHQHADGFACRIRDQGTVTMCIPNNDEQGLVWIGAIAFEHTYQSSSEVLRRITKLGLPAVLTIQEYVLSDPAFRKAIALDHVDIKILPANEFLFNPEKAEMEHIGLKIILADEQQRIAVIQKLREQFSDICFIGCHDQERALFGAAWLAIEQGIQQGLQVIVEAYEEARHARSRIGHANGFVLSGNLAEAVYASVTGVTGAHHALSPVVVNFVTNLLASIGLSSGKRDIDPSDPRPEGDADQLHKPMVSHGIVTGTTALLSYAGGLWISGDPIFASTFAFITLILSQLWQALHWRRQSKIAKLNDLLEDRVLAATLIIAVGVLVVITQIPVLAQLAGLTPLGFLDWLIAGGLASIVGPVASKSENKIWCVIKGVNQMLSRPAKPRVSIAA